MHKAKGEWTQVHMESISPSEEVSIGVTEVTVEAGEMEMGQIIVYDICFHLGI